MVWATLRKDPSRAYLEFENHPAPSVVYTFILDKHRNRSAPKDRKRGGSGMGYTSHSVSARLRLRIGAIIKGRRFAGAGEACSFKNSFRASARGWGRPIRITLFGPFRS